eukprot:COSAG06_NODE_2647_length_6509_cov_6.484555_1_plen_127_part_10
MHVALRRAEEACEGELTWDRLHVIVGSAPRGWVEMCAQGADAAPGAHVCGVLWESAVAVRTPHRPRPRSVWTMRVVIYNIHLCTGPFFLTRPGLTFWRHCTTARLAPLGKLLRCGRCDNLSRLPLTG